MELRVNWWSEFISLQAHLDDDETHMSNEGFGGILKRIIYLSDIYAVFELSSHLRGSESLQTSFVTDQLGHCSVWSASKCWPVLLSDLFLILPWQPMRCLCSFFSGSTNLGGSSLLISQLDAWRRQGRWRSDPPSLSCPVRPNSLGILKRKKIHSFH